MIYMKKREAIHLRVVGDMGRVREWELRKGYRKTGNTFKKLISHNLIDNV